MFGVDVRGFVVNFYGSIKLYLRRSVQGSVRLSSINL